MKSKQRFENFLDWLVKNHIRARMFMFMVVLAGLLTGREFDSQVVKLVCFACVVPTLSMLLLGVDAWQSLFHIKSNNKYE